jgi:hypothetical protein
MKYTIEVSPYESSFVEEFLNRMKIKFSKSSNEENVVNEDKEIYNKDFVEKILQGEKEINEGKGILVDFSDLEKICK